MIRELARSLGLSADQLNYLVHVDDRRGIVYFETPKVGCTSIKKYMQDMYVGSSVALQKPGDVHDRGHSPLKMLRELGDAEAQRVVQGNYKRFSFVRNPYARVLSAYLDKIVHNAWERRRHLPALGFVGDAPPAFPDFLLRLQQLQGSRIDIHFMSQVSLLIPEKITFDFMGCFERFEADFAALRRVLYRDDDTERNYARVGKHHQTNALQKVQTYISDREAQLIQTIYDKDFDAFGYSRRLDQAGDPPISRIRANM